MNNENECKKLLIVNRLIKKAKEVKTMYSNLAAEIKRTGLTQKEFSKIVKISEVVFSRKLNGESEFKLSEIKRILEYFDLKLSFDYLFENFQVEVGGVE